VTPSEILAAFRALPLHRRYDAMRMACTYALEVWDRYAKAGEPVLYTDGVVGLQHVVDMRLPYRAIEAVDRKLAGDTVDAKAIWDAYREPITALQDGDLDFLDDIASAYYAIYNLFGSVFGLCKLYDEGEIVINQAYAGDGYLEEWWTRTWDAWASRGDVAYAPSELDAPTFDAIAEGDLARAIDRCPQGTRLHAVLLAFAHRKREAVAIAARALGLDEDAWLDRNVGRVAASDALVVGDRYYAAICGRRYVVRAVDGNEKRMSGTCGFTIRRVAMSPALVIFAGDDTDHIGAYKTILVGDELHTADHGYRAEHLGTRTIVALGPKAEVVAASDREVGVLTNSGYQRFGEGRVGGAVFDQHGDYLCTYAGATFTLWRRAKRNRLVEMDLDAEIGHAMFAGNRLVLARKDGRAHVLSLALIK